MRRIGLCAAAVSADGRRATVKLVDGDSLVSVLLLAPAVADDLRYAVLGLGWRAILVPVGPRWHRGGRHAPRGRQRVNERGQARRRAVLSVAPGRGEAVLALDTAVHADSRGRASKGWRGALLGRSPALGPGERLSCAVRVADAAPPLACGRVRRRRRRRVPVIVMVVGVSALPSQSCRGADQVARGAPTLLGRLDSLRAVLPDLDFPAGPALQFGIHGALHLSVTPVPPLVP